MSPLKVERGLFGSNFSFVPLGEKEVVNFEEGDEIFVRGSRWGWVSEGAMGKGACLYVTPGIRLVIYGNGSKEAVENRVLIKNGEAVIVAEKANDLHGQRVVRMSYLSEKS